jgi:alpha-L-fucosidase 2
VGDGEFAFKQLDLLLGKRTLPNLFDLCGPFQIDGNFGAAAGIAEMLLQSHARSAAQDEALALPVIDLLPALPQAWPNGSITGLCARGGFEIDMDWRGGALTRVMIRSKLGQTCFIKYKFHEIKIETKPGRSYIFDGELVLKR